MPVDFLTQLNRHEGRHRLARETFRGHRGEVRQSYREGQEYQLGALGLLTNVIVLSRYSFTRAEPVVRGELRPLQTPQNQEIP